MHSTAGPAMSLLLFTSYAALLFNGIATVGSLFLIDRVGDIDLNEARKGGTPITDGYIDPPRSSLQLLREFGGHRNLKYIFIQWVAYLFLGTVFIFLQALTYLWVYEGPVISIILTVLTGLAIVELCFTSYLDTDGSNT
ncbi:hypothetical protein DFH09DRAFT_1197651 [Mycena vulgaris]|nr:hypothetical protein DFH09DRAFT_1197651 [Mycena vulgaris]